LFTDRKAYMSFTGLNLIVSRLHAVADPDFQLRGRPGLVLLALPAFLPSVIFSFFTQNKGGVRAPQAPPLDPPPTCNMHAYVSLHVVGTNFLNGKLFDKAG